jgi:hypothetical protein
MESIRYAPRDAKIIKDNPGKSPYELQALGISDKAFEKLMSQPTTETEILSDPSLEDSSPVDEVQLSSSTTIDQIQPNIPAQSIPLVPKITTFERSKVATTGQKIGTNQVLIKTPTGKVNPMGREFALKLVAQNSGYTIIG